MSSNASIDFLEMLKGTSAPSARPVTRKRVEKTANSVVSEKRENKVVEKRRIDSSCIAVIDTETNWRDEVMSIGVAVADEKTFKCQDTKYYIIDPEYRVGGIYSNVLRYSDGKRDFEYAKEIVLSRKSALQEINKYLKASGITKIFAYNAKFDYGHLKELGGFEWYDIMRLAAYKQFNRAITEEMTCCKTGRLKTNYGVEPITRMLSGDKRYCEVHNAIYDAVDELRIIELLGHELSAYECARIN